MERIQVTRTTVKPMVFASGDISWGVQHTDGQWFTLFQERKPEKGELIEVDVKVVEKGGKTFRNAYPKPSEKQVEKAKEVLKPVITATKLYPPQPVLTGNKISDDNIKRLVAGELESANRSPDWKHPQSSVPYSLETAGKVVDAACNIATRNGIVDDAARVSLAATFLIALGQEKLSIEGIDDLESSLDKIDDKAIQADIESNWGEDREWFEGPPAGEPVYTVLGKQVTKEVFDNATRIPTEEDRTPMAGIAQAADMEAAKARMDKYLETVDYKTQLGAAIKTYCAKNKLDFKTNKFEVLWKCAETRNLESLSQAEAKIAIEQLRVMP